jgi:hypothetical protein
LRCGGSGRGRARGGGGGDGICPDGCGGGRRCALIRRQGRRIRGHAGDIRIPLVKRRPVLVVDDDLVGKRIVQIDRRELARAVGRDRVCKLRRQCRGRIDRPLGRGRRSINIEFRPRSSDVRWLDCNVIREEELRSGHSGTLRRRGALPRWLRALSGLAAAGD